MPILLQQCGAVPKGTAPFYRLTTDARLANKFYSDWGVTYTTAAQLSSTLNRCDFHISIDISDAYHLSLWAGCGRELRPVQRPVIVSNGPGQPSEVSWVDAMVNGCTPSTCRGGCDKDLSGIMIDGFVFRFAACQFGQKTAGSPLGSIVRAVARYFARLPDPVHVASWVDDLIFIMSTPEHGDCAGFVGGCPVCTEYHGRGPSRLGGSSRSGLRWPRHSTKMSNGREPRCRPLGASPESAPGSCPGGSWRSE
jgi:hypothetical protein